MQGAPHSQLCKVATEVQRVKIDFIGQVWHKMPRNPLPDYRIGWVFLAMSTLTRSACVSL